jgi:hypothetical protein
MIHLNPMGPSLRDVEEGSPEWHEAICLHLQVLWEDKTRHNVKMIVEKAQDVIEHESWRFVPRPDGTPMQQFCEELLGEPWPALLGMVESFDKDLARRMDLKLKAPVEAREKAGAPKGNKNAAKDKNNVANSNIESSPSSQNRDSADARRLRRDRPELWDQVEAGELSLNAAALEAGFRRPSVQITDADPQAAAERIREKLGQDFAQQLKEEL